MKPLARTIGRGLRALHADERGADMVEYILIIAAIALPLLAVVLIYRNEIAAWAKRLWDRITSTPDPVQPG